MIFLLQGDLGDCITMLPAVMEYRRFRAGRSYVFADPRIKALLPQYDWLHDERSLPTYSLQNVVSLNVWDAVAKLGKDLHPTRMFFRYLGLDDPGETVRPEIMVDESAPAYDYVIAPFANDRARALTHEQWIGVVNRLTLERCGDVAVVGDFRDDPIFQSYSWGDIYADAVIGKPLPYVAGLMRNARKAVITVDSMANRLAHAAGVENHILLCSDVVPEAWATHPGARVLYGPPSSWTVEKVLELLPA